MEGRNEIRTFLASRRAMITSEQAGVAAWRHASRAWPPPAAAPFPAFGLDGGQSRLVGVRHRAKIDTCSVNAMNDSRQLASAVPELRSTWRTRSSCSTAGACWPTSMTSTTATDASGRGVYRRLLQAGPDEISIDTSVDHVRERASGRLPRLNPANN